MELLTATYLLMIMKQNLLHIELYRGTEINSAANLQSSFTWADPKCKTYEVS